MTESELTVEKSTCSGVGEKKTFIDFYCGISLVLLKCTKMYNVFSVWETQSILGNRSWKKVEGWQVVLKQSHSICLIFGTQLTVSISKKQMFYWVVKTLGGTRIYFPVLFFFKFCTRELKRVLFNIVVIVKWNYAYLLPQEPISSQKKLIETQETNIQQPSNIINFAL